MADHPETWPPPPTNQSLTVGLRLPKKRSAGLVMGTGMSLLYSVGVCYAADNYAGTTASCWRISLLFGLSASVSSSAFIVGLSAGSLVLLLLLVLLQSRLRGFSIGLITGFIPFMLMFLCVLLLYPHAPKEGPCYRL